MPIESPGTTDPVDEVNEIQLLEESLSTLYEVQENLLEFLRPIKQIVDNLIPALEEAQASGNNASLRSRLLASLKQIPTAELRNEETHKCEVGDIVVLNEPETSPDYQVPWLVRETYKDLNQVDMVYLILYDLTSRTIIMDEIAPGIPKRDMRVLDSRCLIIESREDRHAQNKGQVNA